MTLRNICSQFHSRSFCNDSLWETFWVNLHHIINAEVAIAPLATMPKSFHCPSLILYVLVKSYFTPCPKRPNFASTLPNLKASKQSSIVECVASGWSEIRPCVSHHKVHRGTWLDEGRQTDLFNYKMSKLQEKSRKKNLEEPKTQGTWWKM